MLPLLWVAIWERRREIEDSLELVIVIAGLSVVCFQELLHPLMFKQRMQFLPLMLNSLYSAAFNLGWVGKMYLQQLGEEGGEEAGREKYAEVPEE